MNRRNFPHNTRPHPLSPSLKAASAQSTPKRGPNDHVQIGCIGFGIMGQGDVRTAVGLPRVEIVEDFSFIVSGAQNNRTSQVEEEAPQLQKRGITKGLR